MDHLTTSKTIIAAEAIDWFLSIQERTHDNSDAFANWLLRSPTHIEEFLAVSYTWASVKIVDDGAFATAALIAAAQHQPEPPSNVVALHDDGDGYHTKPIVATATQRSWWRRTGIAAALLIAALAWPGYTTWQHANELSTAVGEQRSITLADGSLLFLNTDSRVRLRWTDAERHIDLLRGEARFQVVKNPARPFVVATHEAAVRAVGTVFNVRADGASTQVAVLEGRVVVVALDEAPSPGRATSTVSSRNAARRLPHLELAAGQRAAITPDGIQANVGPPLEGVTTWTQRRLVFRAQPLREVVAEFNRYHAQQLHVDDAQLAALQISGSFDAIDTESLIAYLKEFETVRVERSATGDVHLVRSRLTNLTQ